MSDRDDFAAGPLDSRRAQIEALVPAAMRLVADWEDRFGPYAVHPSTALDPAALDAALSAFAQRMDTNYPFFHPRFAGQMLKPPHPAAVAGYLAGMLVNTNNHSLDGGPATTWMEREAVTQIAAMLGLPDDGIGHLTGGGTVANLEALFVARQLRPGTAVAHSAQSHYTHARMCHVLGIESRAIPCDAAGRMDLDALEAQLKTGEVGTVVLTAGTTGTGAVDPIRDALGLRDRYGVRLHVDAAYGGFFTLLARGRDPLVPADLSAVGACDSVVIDPHKHGLQPYGCGAILLGDPDLSRFYQHDSPYTYFTSDDLHLGEIALECSRPGASAAALWFTLQLLPLEAERGLGPILAASLRAARDFGGRVRDGDALVLLQAPPLDIVTYFPDRAAASAVDAASRAVLEAGMAADDPVFLSLLQVDADALAAARPGLARDADGASVLRSVLMKPEHELATAWLHGRVSALAAAAG